MMMDFSLPTKEAFELAITLNVLSDNSEANNFAGNYMYMGRNEDGHNFKHIDTRKYLYCPA
jgi:hypothetical protein